MYICIYKYVYMHLYLYLHIKKFKNVMIIYYSLCYVFVKLHYTLQICLIV